MASSSRLLNKLEEDFLQCAVCMEQICDPRSLPCLHRYCCECLKTLVHRNQCKINCPDCRTEHALPVEGVNGFKKDFYVQTIIEFIKIQKFLESKQEQLCCGCSETLTVLAFCFKCSGYLCTECYNFHINTGYHKSHILSLKDLEDKSVSFEKLLARNDFLRCKTHAENISQLCCKTCSNLAICVSCTYGEHRSHDVEDVNTYAKSQREKLSQCLSQVNGCKHKVEQMKDNIEGLKRDIVANEDTAKELMLCRSEDMITNRGRDIIEINDETELDVKTIVEKYNIEAKEDEKRMSEEIEAVRMKWEHILQVNKETMTAKIQDKRNSNKQATAPLDASIECILEDTEVIEMLLDSLKQKKLTRADELSQQTESTLNRYDNLVMTAKSILASKSNWTAAQSIGDICTAAHSLLQDMVTMSCYTVNEFKLINVFDVKSPIFRKWDTSCMTITGNGNFVISGRKTDSKSSGIILFNDNGKIVKEQYFQHTYHKYDMICAAFKTFQIASICPPDEVSLFDIRDCTFSKTYLRRCPGWKQDLEVISIATDDVNNIIIIGCVLSRDMYVLNGNLSFCRVFTLTPFISWPLEMVITADVLFVCDVERMRAFAVNTVGEFLYEFPKPDTELRFPCSVCADQDGHAFFVWVHEHHSVHDVLAKYSRHTGYILATTNDAKGSIGIKTVNSNGEYKLHMPTEDTNGILKVFTYTRLCSVPSKGFKCNMFL